MKAPLILVKDQPTVIYALSRACLAPTANQKIGRQVPDISMAPVRCLVVHDSQIYLQANGPDGVKGCKWLTASFENDGDQFLQNLLGVALWLTFI